MPGYDENTLRGLAARVIHHTTETLSRTAAEEAINQTLSSIYGAVEDIVKQGAKYVTIYNLISSGPNKITEFREFAKRFLGCVLRHRHLQRLLLNRSKDMQNYLS